MAALAAGGQLAAGDALAGFALWAPLARTVGLEVAGEARAVRVETLGPGRFRVDGRAVEVAGWNQGEVMVVVDGARRGGSGWRWPGGA